MTKEKKAAYMRQWRAEHPEYREYMREWREANKEKIVESRRQYYEDHHDEEKANSYAWRDQHRLEYAIHAKVAAANQRYGGRICAQDIRDLIDRDGWFCCWCKKPIETLRDFTLEHLEPINDPEILAIACHSCNAAKLPRLGLIARLTRKEYLARRADKKRAYDTKWREEHREQHNAAQRARYWAHVEERRAYFREWQQKKRDAARKLSSE